MSQLEHIYTHSSLKAGIVSDDLTTTGDNLNDEEMHEILREKVGLQMLKLSRIKSLKH